MPELKDILNARHQELVDLLGYEPPSGSVNYDEHGMPYVVSKLPAADDEEATEWVMEARRYIFMSRG